MRRFSRSSSRGAQPRNNNGRFVSNTEHMLEVLHSKLGEINGSREVISQKKGVLLRRRETATNTLVISFLPDLAVGTVAKLKAACPGFVNETINAKITETRNIKVPFWTWVFGNAASYRKNIINARLNAIRGYLKSWLRTNSPPAYSAIAEMQAEIDKLIVEDEDLAGKQVALQTQIEGLENVLRTYSRPDAPPPPKNLEEAVTSSADGMRNAQANAPIAGTSSSGGGLDVWDYLILDRILEERHNHDSETGGYYHPDGSVYEPTSTVSPWGEATTPSRGDRGGNSSVRMDDADDTSAGGNSSVRMDDSDDTSAGGTSSVRRDDAENIKNDDDKEDDDDDADNNVSDSSDAGSDSSSDSASGGGGGD